MADEPATRHLPFIKDEDGGSWTLTPSSKEGAPFRFQTYLSLSADSLAHNLIKKSVKLRQELHHTRELLRQAKTKTGKIKKDGAPEGQPVVAYRGGIPPARDTPTRRHRMSAKEYRELFTAPLTKRRRDGPPRSPTPLTEDNARTDDDQEEDREEREYETEHSTT